MEKIDCLNPNWLLDFGIIDINNCSTENQENEKNKDFSNSKLCNTCNDCGDKFIFLLVRQNRCDICGNYYCSKCIDKKLQLGVKNSKEIKVCKKCFQLCQSFNETIENFLINEKNTSFVEMKENYYCRTFDDYQYSCEAFLEDEDKKFEQQLKINVNDIYDLVIKTLINHVLQKNFTEDEIIRQWKNTIYILLKETISNLRPCSRFLNDSLDINDYIKIKIVLYKDTSMSQVIQGYAMTKKDKIKNLKKEISNPKILLINSDKTPGNKNNILNNVESKVLYSRFILNKVDTIKPDLVIIGKDFPQEITEILLEDNSNNINIIYDVKNTSLKNISRCTKTIILPSFNLIGTNNILGSCKQIRCENFRYEDENKDLLIFDGCDRLLFNTIILSGNDIHILKKLKKLFKQILLPTTRDLFLQKFLQYNLNMEINSLPPDTDCETEFIEELLESGNEITKLESDKYISKSSPVLRKLSSSNNCDKKDLSNLFYEGFDMSITEKKEDFNIYSLTSILMSQKLNNNNNDSSNSKILPKENDEEMTEKDILNNMSKYCEEPKDNNFSFFNSDYHYDKPLGIFLFDICKQSNLTCHSCNLVFSKHKCYLYKSNGVIIYSMISNDENQLDKVIQYLKTKTNTDYSKLIMIKDNKNESLSQLANGDIYTYGYCKKCQSIVTPLFKLSNEVYNYSASKFLRIILENHLSKNQKRSFNYNIKNLCSNPKCEHIIHKDISRIFITQFGSWKFEYNDITKYYIMPNNLNYKKKGPSFSETLFKKYFEEGYNNSIKVMSMIQTLIKAQVKFYESLLTDEKMVIFTEYINSFIDLLNALYSFNDKYVINVFINKYLKENSDNYNNCYIKLIVNIRKIYRCILKIKSTLDKVESLKINIKVISDILNQIIPYSYEENLKIIKTFKKEKQIELQEKKIESAPISINFDEEPAYRDMVIFNSYTDDKHNIYSVNFNPDDLSSVISNILSSNSYIKLMKVENGINLSSIKSERNSNEVVNDVISRNLSNKRKFSSISKISKNKEDKFDTLLVFEQEKQNFYIDNKNVSNDEILKILEEVLTSTDYDKEIVTNVNDFDKKESKDKTDIASNCSSIENELNNITNENIDNRNEDKIENNSSNSITEIPDINPENNNEKENTISNDYHKFSFYNKEITKQIHNLKKRFIDLREKLSESIKFQNSYKFDENNIPMEIKYPQFPSVPEFEKIAKFKKHHSSLHKTQNILIDKTIFDVRIFYAKQFEALRIAYCATTEDIIISLSKSTEWSDNSGGKSKSFFLKTLDERFVYKSLTESEFNMFIDNIFAYFKYISQFLFHKMPSSLAKILGAYKVIAKSPNGKEKQYYLILMENLFYGLTIGGKINYNSVGSNLKVYDLKGSKSNRYIKKKDRKPGQVLLDTNFVEDFNREPLFIESNVFDKLKKAFDNDTAFLNKLGVIDYSLLLVIDTSDNKKNNDDEDLFDLYGKKTNYKLIKLGIIDYCRKYTWDKQLEFYGKTIIYRELPTITEPENYSKRFNNEVGKYFVGI